MKKVFKLEEDEIDLNKMLNDPKIRLKHIRVNCDKKTSLTTVVVDYSVGEVELKRVRKRRINRFHLLDGTDRSLDTILESKDYRVVKQYDFVTENGLVVVLDFEDRRS